ncbi:MAG: hypothetical protein L3K24_09495 [Gammaproteobacteria bacterium]|nr:hypothetical protein [Gammaproteobacteria bacterium]
MIILITVLGVLGIIIQISSRKINEHEKPTYLVILQFVVMLMIVILGSYSQYESSKKESAYKQASLEIDVLSKVSEHYLPVMESIIKIQNNFLTMNNYLDFEKAKKNSPELAHVFNWHKTASENQISELEEGKLAFQEIQNIAVEIVKLNMEYEGVLPKKTVIWASNTLKIPFNNIEAYFDPFAPLGEKPKKSVLEYSRDTGEAFGLVIGRIKHAVAIIKEK